MVAYELVEIASVKPDRPLVETLGSASSGKYWLPGQGIELYMEGFGPGVEPFCLCRPISLWYAICNTREKTASFILTSARLKFESLRLAVVKNIPQ